jgi:hypothetical protein
MYYKEWIKTRWYLLLMLIATLGVVGYCLLFLHGLIARKGIDHVWFVIITRDATFINTLQFVPLIAGTLLAIVQFVPEMYHKCLKLTLHLPAPHLRVVTQMLAFGLIAMVVCSLLNLLLLWVYLEQILVVELWSRILLTALPWYLAGLAAYLLGAWIILEPTWRGRVFNLIVALLVVRIYFVCSIPTSYNGFLPWLSLFTIALLPLSWISIARFKEGKE